jgi:hypothetical protein
MGFSYTSITLKGADQAPVVQYLRRLGRDAYVSPTIGGVTVVYDREAEEQDTAVLQGLAEQLSRQFHVPALAALVHDSDVLWYGLFEDGRRLDEYKSEPAYFLDIDPVPPNGGDAAVLARVFGAEDRADEIEAILRQWDDDSLEDYPFAEERHQALAEALSLPPYAHGAGYNSIDEDEVSAGADRARLIKTS